MASGTSLPSDFTPVPQVLLPHMRQAFVARSIALLGTLVGGPGSPIVQQGDPGFATGGQYLEGPTFSRIVTANRRDITSTSGLTAQKPAGVNNKGVLINRRTDLYAFADDTYIAGFTREQISQELGIQAGEMLADDVCSNIIATLIGAVEALSASAHSYSPWSATVRTNLSPDVLDSARYLMGDSASRLTHFITRSESDLDLRNDAKGRGYDVVGGATLLGANDRNSNGMTKVVRDDASLTIADAGFDKYLTLLLGPEAMFIGFPKPFEFETIRVISNETKMTYWRGDWDMFVRVNGMAYNSGAGGANPTTTALKTSSNWTDNTTSAKEVRIAEAIHNYSGN